MSAPGEDRDRRTDEAERLWLARAIASPDAWRLRATNAAGLLSAAAAASVAGLILRDQPLAGSVKPWAELSAVAYVVSVVAYLVAGVMPSPKKDKETLRLVDEIWDYCEDEAKPIRWAVRVGTIAAAVAIASTGVTFFRSAEDGAARVEHPAIIAFTAPAASRAVQSICPRLVLPVSASVRFVDSDRLRVHLAPGACGGAGVDIELGRADVVIKLTAEP